MNIQLAQENDLSEILELLCLLLVNMQQNGFNYWNKNYPSEKIPSDISQQCLYKVVVEEVILGIVSLNESQDKNYASLSWKYGGNILAVHRLAVHPKAQRKGIGWKLMQFAEDFAQQNGYDAIRLDTYSQGFMVDFYKKMNYQVVGNVILNPEVDFFVCLEKEIRPLR